MARGNGDPNLKSPARRACLQVVKARGWGCYRCGKPIDYSLKVGPWRWEGDEIIARYLGGDPCDPANVVASHARCNRREGAKITNAKRRAKTQQLPRRLIPDSW